MLGHDLTGGGAAGDVADMGRRRARRMGAAPDAVVVQAENRHAASLTGRSATTQTRRPKTV